MSEKEYHTITVDIEAITGGAVLCDDSRTKGFIPKVCIRDWDDNDYEEGQEAVELDVERDWLEKKGWA